VAGAVGGVLVGAAVTAKQVLKRYVPIWIVIVSECEIQSFYLKKNINFERSLMLGLVIDYIELFENCMPYVLWWW
jgi:bifunctional DNase/RNase